MTVLLTLHPVSGFVITHENYYWLLSRMRIEDLLRCWPRSASVMRSHIGCRACARVNTATQPGIRKDAYYFKVRFACASNNQTRCAIRDKFVKKASA